jgi:DNA repair exonuclease SbcCD ATPase subunit
LTAEEIGLDDLSKNPYGLQPWANAAFNTVRKMVDDFENFEAIRRVQEKKDKFTNHVAELVKRKNAVIAFLQKLAEDILNYKTLEWNEAKHDKDLNGLVFVEKPRCKEKIIDELNTLAESPGPVYIRQVYSVPCPSLPARAFIILFWGANHAFFFQHKVQGMVDDLPVIEEFNTNDEFKLPELDETLDEIERRVEGLREMQEAVDASRDMEIKARLALDEEAMDAEEKARQERVKSGMTKVGSNMLMKRFNKKMTSKAREKIDQKNEEALRLQNESEEAARKRKELIAEEKAQMEAELAKIRGRTDARDAQLAEVEREFNAKSFESEEQKQKEEEIFRRAEKKRKEKEEFDARLAQKRAEKLEIQLKEQEEELRIANEKLEKERAVRAKIEKRMEDEKQRDAAEFHTERLRWEARQKKKDAEKKKQQDLIAAERAAVDEGDDDTDDEKTARKEARKKIQAYEKIKYPATEEEFKTLAMSSWGDPFDPKRAGTRMHTVWTAARSEDMRIVKAYFLLAGGGGVGDGGGVIASGASLLCGQHCPNTTNYKSADSGRTLMHIAAWYGNERLFDYIVNIGADVNMWDTSYNKFTPLMEAARSGKVQLCRKLLMFGADIRKQDYQVPL